MGQSIFTDSSVRIPPPWPHDAEALKRIEESRYPFGLAERDYDETGEKDVPAVIVRFLGEDDIDVLHKVHLDVVASLPHAHIYRADDRDFMAAHIERRGRTLGVFHYQDLVGYATLSLPGGDADNLGPMAPIEKSEYDRIAHFDGSGVLEGYRGNSLQTFLNAIRGDFAVTAGYRHLMATVSPMNPYSLINLIATGFQIVNFAVKYGGMDRLILYRNGDIPVPDAPAAVEGTHAVALSDRDQLQEKLTGGFVGHSIKENDGEYSVLVSKIAG